MASGSAYNIDGVIVKVGLTSHMDPLACKAEPFALEWQLDDALFASTLPTEALTQIVRLCNLLDRAESAVIVTKRCGLDKTFTTLVPCVNVALKARAAVR